MEQDKIFTFWEPKNQVFPYLELCKATWDLYLSEYEIITLDYSNINEYLQEDIYDLSELKKLTLPMQKDAIMVAVLKAHGGIFMDMDTLILGDIKPITDKLKKTEVVMIGYHNAFLATKTNSRLLTFWLKETQSRLIALQNYGDTNLKWDYFGNGALTQAMEEIKNGLLIEVIFNRLSNIKLFNFIKKSFIKEKFIKSRILFRLKKLKNKLNSKKRNFYFSTILKKYLNSLDRLKYRYILEEVHFKEDAISAQEKYSRFWFGKGRDIEEVISKKPIIIGLHNSWTPKWYKELSEEEVLQNDSLLSKTLDFAINGTQIRRIK